MKIIIAQCTKEKRDGKHRAKEMYSPSDLFKAQRRYAEAYADEWYILSGKYGLINPWKTIQSYDKHINEGWGEIIQENISNIVRTWVEYDTNIDVELICGHEDYANKLIPYLDYEGVDYTEPFKGMGIGDRQQAMIREARKVENNQLQAYA